MRARAPTPHPATCTDSARPDIGRTKTPSGGASRGVDVAPRDPARARPLSTPCRARTAQACRARPSPHRRRPSGGARRDRECFSHAAPRVPAPGAPAWSWVPQAEPPVGSRAGNRLRVYIQVRPTRTERSCPPPGTGQSGLWVPLDPAVARARGNSGVTGAAELTRPQLRAHRSPAAQPPWHLRLVSPAAGGWHARSGGPGRGLGRVFCSHRDPSPRPPGSKLPRCLSPPRRARQAVTHPAAPFGRPPALAADPVPVCLLDTDLGSCAEMDQSEVIN